MVINVENNIITHLRVDRRCGLAVRQKLGTAEMGVIFQAKPTTLILPFIKFITLLRSNTTNANYTNFATVKFLPLGNNSVNGGRGMSSREVRLLLPTIVKIM